jgi:hypothetical protein
VTKALTMATNRTNANAFLPALIAPSRSGVLERKCDCGQHTGGGTCEACKRKRPGAFEGGMGDAASRGIGRTAPDSDHHGFAEIRVTAGSPERIGRTMEPAVAEASPEDAAERKYSDKGVLMTLAGSGTCANGGAESGCDPDTGAYKIYHNNNTCCTKDCSWLHEQTHASDITGWGCCKALSVAYNKPGADKAAAVQKYNDWLDSARSLTECHAYKNAVDCAKQLAKQKDCSGAGRDTDCCKDVEEYRAKYSARATTECAAAPKQAPPCPTY